jgi:hypothetical protein
VSVQPQCHPRRQAWRERMAELAKSETAQLEAERRHAQAAEAGKLAAQSPNHANRYRFNNNEFLSNQKL